MPSNERLTSKPYSSERVYWEVWDHLTRIRETRGEAVALQVAKGLLTSLKRKERNIK